MNSLVGDQGIREFANGGLYFFLSFLLFIVEVLKEVEDGEDSGCESRFTESQRLL